VIDEHGGHDSRHGAREGSSAPLPPIFVSAHSKQFKFSGINTSISADSKGFVGKTIGTVRLEEISSFR